MDPNKKLIIRLHAIRTRAIDEIDHLSRPSFSGAHDSLSAKQNVSSLIDDTITQVERGEYVRTIAQQRAAEKPINIEDQVNNLANLAYQAGTYESDEATSSDVTQAVNELLEVIKKQITEKDKAVTDPRLSAAIHRTMTDPYGDESVDAMLESWITEAQCLEAEVKGLNENLEDKTEQLEHLHSARESACQDAQDLDDQLTALQAQYSTKNHKIESLTNEVDRTNTEYETKLEIIASLHDTIRTLTIQCEAQDQEIVDLLQSEKDKVKFIEALQTQIKPEQVGGIM